MSKKLTPSVLKNIESGDWDEHLSTISAGIKARREAIRRAAFLSFEPGDRVVGIGSSKDDGWNGLQGKVVKRRETRILVKMDAGQPSKWAGREVVCPPDMIAAA